MIELKKAKKIDVAVRDDIFQDVDIMYLSEGWVGFHFAGMAFYAPLKDTPLEQNGDTTVIQCFTISPEKPDPLNQPTKIKMIKAVRQGLDLGLRDAKRMVDGYLADSDQMMLLTDIAKTKIKMEKMEVQKIE